MIAWLRSIDWPDPLEALFLAGMFLGMLIVAGLWALLVGAMMEAARRDASAPHELSTNDGSVPPAIITDRATGCQYLRGD